MSSRLETKNERKRQILELALTTDGLTANMVSTKLDINALTVLGILTDLLGEGYFTLTTVGETNFRVFVPDKEKIKDALEKRQDR